ncbi:MAG: DUF2203 domain-containing protein [Solirubrobacterales bacterium]
MSPPEADTTGGHEDRRRAFQRHFTTAEANATLPTLRPLLEKLREAKDELTDEELHEALSESAPGNGGGEPGRAVGVAFLEVRRILVALTEAGVVVKDIDRGLVDFPALMEDREVFLCWELGEDEVAHWHEIDAGYRGRRPLD